MQINLLIHHTEHIYIFFFYSVYILYLQILTILCTLHLPQKFSVYLRLTITICYWPKHATVSVFYFCVASFEQKTAFDHSVIGLHPVNTYLQISFGDVYGFSSSLEFILWSKYNAPRGSWPSENNRTILYYNTFLQITQIISKVLCRVCVCVCGGGGSTHTLTLGFTQLLTEMSTRTTQLMFLGSKVRPAHRADNLLLYVSRLSNNVGSLAFHKSIGLPLLLRE
jgi:hypothetical protein